MFSLNIIVPKTRKTANPPHTPKKRGKEKSHRKAPTLPELPLSDIDVEVLSDDENLEPSLRDVVSLLGNISARLFVNEEKEDNFTSHRDVQGLADEPEPSTSRGTERRG